MSRREGTKTLKEMILESIVEIGQTAAKQMLNAGYYVKRDTKFSVY